jgi:hypothetical protein
LTTSWNGVWGTFAVLAGAHILSPSKAFGAEPTDGAYGRLDGDLLLQAGAGVAVALGGPQLAIDLRALYLSSAGLYFRYGESFGQKNAVTARSLSTGVEIRPMFLARWARDLEKGPARLDLFVDSFSIDFGAGWLEPNGAGFHPKPAFEIGLGLEFPLLAQANGPYVGALGMLRLDDLERGDKRDLLEQGSIFLFTLSWHGVVKLGLADIKDRR